MSDSPKAAEIAEAILIVLRKIMKWLGLSALAIVAILSIIFGALYFEEQQNSERRTQAARQAALEGARKRVKRQELVQQSLNVSVSVGEAPCARDRPFKVFINNLSNKTINRVDYTLVVRYVGRSTTLNDSNEVMSSDIILGPQQDSWECVTVFAKNGYKTPLVLSRDSPKFEVTAYLKDAWFDEDS